MYLSDLKIPYFLYSSSVSIKVISMGATGAAVAAVVSRGNVGDGGSSSSGGGGVRCGGGGGNSGVRWRGGVFPDPARIIRPNMHEHLVMIFRLMAEQGVHVETGTCSQKAFAAWQSVFDQYFYPINGMRRAWSMWLNPCERVAKSRKSVMATLQFHSNAFNKGETALTQVQISANNLVVKRNTALAAQEAAVAQQTQHQGCLLAALPTAAWVLSHLVEVFWPHAILDLM
jgi:hypothetical protein